MQPKEGFLNENIIKTIKDLKRMNYNSKQIAFLTNINEDIVISITNNIIKDENIPKKLNLNIEDGSKENILNRFILKETIINNEKDTKLRDLKEGDK